MSTIAELETQIYELKQKLAEARQQNPPEQVHNYQFETLHGVKSLADFFGEHNHLFIIHNMGENCSYCTHWADILDPIFKHIESRAAVALCTPDELTAAQKFAQSRNWTYALVNDNDRGFSREMGYYKTYSEDGQEHSGVWPGISAFRKNSDGSIVRLNHTQFGPLDDFCPTWHLLDLIQTSDWEPS